MILDMDMATVGASSLGEAAFHALFGTTLDAVTGLAAEIEAHAPGRPARPLLIAYTTRSVRALCWGCGP